MNNLTTDTQDEIVRALGDKINYHRRGVKKYGNVAHVATFSPTLEIYEENRLAQAISAYNEVAQQLNIKPISDD